MHCSTSHFTAQAMCFEAMCFESYIVIAVLVGLDKANRALTEERTAQGVKHQTTILTYQLKLLHWLLMT
jgi:hypothetical protein